MLDKDVHPPLELSGDDILRWPSTTDRGAVRRKCIQSSTGLAGAGSAKRRCGCHCCSQQVGTLAQLSQCSWLGHLDENTKSWICRAHASMVQFDSYPLLALLLSSRLLTIHHHTFSILPSSFLSTLYMPHPLILLHLYTLRRNLDEDISNWTCTFAMCLWIGGDVCFFFLSDWYLEWFLAIAHIGGIVAPLNHRWVSSRILNYTFSVPKNIKRKICTRTKTCKCEAGPLSFDHFGPWAILRFQLLPPFSVPSFHDQAEHRLLVQLLILNHNSFWVIYYIAFPYKL